MPVFSQGVQLDASPDRAGHLSRGLLSDEIGKPGTCVLRDVIVRIDLREEAFRLLQ